MISARNLKTKNNKSNGFIRLKYKCKLHLREKKEVK